MRLFVSVGASILLAPHLALASSLDSSFLTSTSGTTTIKPGDTIQFEITVTTNPGQDYRSMYWRLTGDIGGTVGSAAHLGWPNVDGRVVAWDWHYTPPGFWKVKFGTNGRISPNFLPNSLPSRASEGIGFFGLSKIGDGIPSMVGTVTIQPDIDGVFDAAAAISASLGGGFFDSNGTPDVVTINSATFTVDPESTTAETAKFVPANSTTGTDFGRTLAASGTAAVIGGGPLDAYVFRRIGGLWSEEVGLVATGRRPGDNYGNAVAISGDTVLVGANFDDEIIVQAGATYVFRDNGAGWVQEVKLLASDGGIGHRFGEAVAIEGDVAVVGALKVNAAVNSPGAVYVFRHNGTSWVEEQILEASGADGHMFGRSVAISGNRLMVGAGTRFDPEGGVYVFSFNGSAWVEDQAIAPALPNAVLFFGRQFGSSLALEGARALIGAPHDGLESNGAAYLFSFNGSQWVEEQKLVADVRKDSDLYGSSVALSGERALVGAPNSDTARAQPGIAYLYSFDGNTLELEDKFRGADTVELDYFGAAVSFASGEALGGANGDGNSDFSTPYGAVYVVDVALATLNVPSFGGLGLTGLMLFIGVAGWRSLRQWRLISFRVAEARSSARETSAVAGIAAPHAATRTAPWTPSPRCDSEASVRGSAAARSGLPDVTQP